MAAALVTLTLRGGWSLLLGWPAVSFAVVGMAYFLGDARVFGKRDDGSRYWLATAALLPYLLFAHLVWLAQISLSAEPAASVVNDWLVISRRLRSHELPPQIAQICDLTCELTDPARFRLRDSYVCHPILDAGAADAARLAAFAKLLPPSDAGKLLIHCANGHGRTGMFAAIWLLAHGFATSADDAVEAVQKARPGVSLRRRQYHLILEVDSLLQGAAEPSQALESAAQPGFNGTPLPVE